MKRDLCCLYALRLTGLAVIAFPSVLPELNITKFIIKNPVKSQNPLLEFSLGFRKLLFFYDFVHTFLHLTFLNLIMFVDFFFSSLSFTVKLVFLFLETHFKLPGYFLLLWTSSLVPEGSMVYFV